MKKYINRVCTKCSIKIHADIGVPRKRNKDGWDSICRACYNKRIKANLHKKNPPKNIFTNCIYEYINKKTICKDNGCIEWVGVVGKSGRHNIDHNKWGRLYKAQTAPQLVYLVYKGEYDRSLYICHKCHNKVCVNIDHLYTGTPTENVADMVRAGRAAWQLCNKGRWIK